MVHDVVAVVHVDVLVVVGDDFACGCDCYRDGFLLGCLVGVLESGYFIFL